ncbi:MAG: Na/Pi symporter [Deltaproteobacteria bacterium]|jgi:Na+/phosphate symporter|nr:Na/Pi symporter [Deltaproteobacteria bacterium]
MGLFGGLALFLAGLDMLSEGLKMSAGDALKTLLSKMTTNRILGAMTGAFITAVLNSSSVTTVLVVSFITANVMTLAQSVGVIMGTNIGSTMTAQLLAFNIAAYALLPIAMASEGLLTLPAGIALALGANIGTCVTAMLASMGKPVEAVRAAVVHILFNIIGVLIWLPFIS